MMTFSMPNFLLPVPQVVHEDAAPQVVRGREVGAAFVYQGQLVHKIYQRRLLRQHKRRNDDLIPSAGGCFTLTSVASSPKSATCSESFGYRVWISSAIASATFFAGVIRSSP